MNRACKDCGKPISKRAPTGRCRGCAGRAAGKAGRIHPDKQCRVCGKEMSRYSTSGLCREHFFSECIQSPETQAKRTAAIRRHAKAHIEEKRAQLRVNHRKALAEKPSYRDALRQRARRIQPLGVAASLKPEALARRGQAISERYRREAEERKAKAKRPMTFEEQLVAVAEGRARIVPNWQPSSRDPEFTIAGVASGWMG